MDERIRSVKGFGRFLLLVGSLLLLVTAYVQGHSGEPLQLISETTLQIVVSFLFLCFGVAMTAAPLKPITWQAELRKHTIDQSDSKLGFANIHHRGTLLFKDDE